MRGSTSCDCSWPLIDMETCIGLVLLSPQRAGGSAAEGTLAEDASDVALVVDRSPAIGARRAVLGGHRAGLGEQVLGRRLANQHLLRAPDVHRRRSDGAAGESGVRDAATLDPYRRRRGHDREVARATLDLLVGAAAARLDLEADLDQQLGRLD